MKNKIKAALEPIHAEEHLKANTRQYVFDRMAEKKEKRKLLRRWSMLAAAACFVKIGRAHV